MLSDETLENAWVRSHARCECGRKAHGHSARCGRELQWEDRGQADARGGWEVYRKGNLTVGDWRAVNQCEILCWMCYQQTTEAEPLARYSEDDTAA
jgi:hypothetical protein